MSDSVEHTREPKFLDDFCIGDRVTTDTIKVSRESIAEFARSYDPQPMHFDDEAARNSFFGELVGSGWQVAALTMRLMVESRPLGSTPIVGLEISQLRFETPLKPDDTLTAEAMVIGIRRSGTSDRGYMNVVVWTRNQDGRLLMTQQWTLLVPVRPENEP